MGFAEPRSKSQPVDPARLPRRLPGESLRRKFWIDHVVRTGLVYGLAVGYACATLSAWLMHLVGSKWPDRWLLLIPTVGLAGWAAWEIRKTIAARGSLLRGADGEVRVADLLLDLRRDGYVALHDLPVQDIGNIDHILIGPGGVLAIETKYWTKKRRQDKVVYDGRTLTVAGFVPDRDPVEQAIRGARFLANRIRQGTTLSMSVRPVVLFVDWYVESPRNADVWVMNPKQIYASVRALPRALSNERIAMIENLLASEALWHDRR